MLQFCSFASLLSCIKCIHGWTVKIFKPLEKFRRRKSCFEGVGISFKGDVLRRKSRFAKTFDHVALKSPQHWTDKTFRWRRCVSRTDFQYLCNECWISGYPVTHHYS